MVCSCPRVIRLHLVVSYPSGTSLAYTCLVANICCKTDTSQELHHDKHHATYVNSYNTAAKKLQEAEKSGDVKTTVGLQALINFHGGGHINHSLFWENLAPKNKGGGEPPKGELSKTIDESYGSLENLKKQFNAALAGIQGSGWGWLVKDTQTGKIGIKTYANQDPVVGQFKPLLGIDAWEHSVSFSKLLRAS